MLGALREGPNLELEVVCGKYFHSVVLPASLGLHLRNRRNRFARTWVLVRLLICHAQRFRHPSHRRNSSTKWEDLHGFGPPYPGCARIPLERGAGSPTECSGQWQWPACLPGLPRRVLEHSVLAGAFRLGPDRAPKEGFCMLPPGRQGLRPWVQEALWPHQTTRVGSSWWPKSWVSPSFSHTRALLSFQLGSLFIYFFPIVLCTSRVTETSNSSFGDFSFSFFFCTFIPPRT